MNRYPQLILTILSVAMLYCADASAQYRSRKAKKEKVKEEVQEISIYDVDTLIQPYPNNRASFHINIQRELKRADLSDGSEDNQIYFSEDTLMTQVLTSAVLDGIEQIEVMIENMPPANEDRYQDNQMRIGYLRLLNSLASDYNRDYSVDPYYYKKRVSNFKAMLIARHEGKLTDFVHNNANLYTLDNANILEGYPEEKGYVYKQMGKEEPKMMIMRLSEFADQPFACDVIANAARAVPNDVYNFASSTNYKLSHAVKSCSDPLVQTIVQIATKSKAPLKAMPFLGDIYNKRKTIAEIDDIADDQDKMYKNLVRLKLSGETLGGTSYSDELAYRGIKYIRTMNELHESPDAVRFKCIEGFTPEELYFLIVNGQDEIYTSSFLGTYNRMMERLKPRPGSSLLDTVHYDHFRTFLRMCAGYNTIGSFLATVEKDAKNQLMKDFISGLEKGKENDLEDAVDVADAFGSIKDAELATFLMEEVTKNYQRCAEQRNRKGLIVYGLLATLFKGNTSDLGLPPINKVNYKSLVNDSGVVVMQFFFYGDDDGKMSYNSFLSNFKDGKWKVSTSKYWTTITSVSSKNPVAIYANLPLPEPEDEEAQGKLGEFLASNNLHPTIIVHRGHSYHLPLTLESLQRQTRIVVLGSCGGYHNLALVLDKSPDAHIVSTKQTGSMTVNEPIIKALDDRLLAGSDINWISMWSDLEKVFTSRDGKTLFNDYVPPHRNLGAIFIKAYRRINNSMIE